MTDDLAAIRDKLVRTPIKDLSEELAAAEAVVANLKHRIMVLESEVTARNAAAVEHGREKERLRHRIAELEN